MHLKLSIGLLQLDEATNQMFTNQLSALGHITQTIQNVSEEDDFDVVFFKAIESGLDIFLNNSKRSAWIAIESEFIESRYDSLLDTGVSDVLILDDLSDQTLIKTLLRVRHSLKIEKRKVIYDFQAGCWNAAGFAKKLEKAIHRTAMVGRPFGTGSIDINEFQKINETHGYEVANQLLTMIAQRLGLLLGGRFCVGRLGGDEFLLLIEDLTDKEEFHYAFDLVRASFTQGFELPDRCIDIESNIGAVLYPECIGGPESLISQAHKAMQTGKHYKQQLFFYDHTATPWFQMDMAAEIRRALRENEFQLHYQPRVDLKTNNVIGMEALIRWPHSKYGNIPPSDFIYMAENNGMILPLGNWILSQAEKDIAEIEAAGIKGLNIAVNISFKQLQDSVFCENLPKRIQNWQSSHSQLEFELTETAVLSNRDLVTRTLIEIARLGVKISLDDFGTGYSALVHVQEFPISIVKIDKSFVQRMEVDPSAKTIVESIVSFAHRLKLEVVGEGIEQLDQLTALKNMGCEQGQGYYFSKALPLAEFIKFTKSTFSDSVKSSE